MALIDQFLQQLGTGDSIKDYAHASRLFVNDNYRLVPRQGFLYHVFFDLDPSIKRIQNLSQIEAGMLVKAVNLPKFTVETKTMNSYNKYNIVQSKIKYDPLQITFHDDHADVVRSLWFDYYNYYYRDGDLGYDGPAGGINQGYYKNTKYSVRDTNNWGYTPRNYSQNSTQQYIKAIRIYSMSKKRFAEYTLVNPMIQSFSHGKHQAGQSDPLEHEMTIAYESVLYAAGDVTGQNGVNMQGFADIHYDKSPSPLTPAGGGTRSILGPGGLFDAGSNVIGNYSKQNYLGAAFTAFRGYQNLKNTNLVGAAKAELTQIGTDILRGNNPLNKLFVPNLGNTADGTPIYEYGKTNKPLTPSNNASNATSNGGGISIPGGVSINPNPSAGLNPGTLAGLGALGLSGASLGATGFPGLGRSVAAGSNAGGLSTFGGLVTGAGSLDKIVKIDPLTGAVAGVGKLPTITPAEAKIASIPGAEANASLEGSNEPLETGVAVATDAAVLAGHPQPLPPGTTSSNTNPDTYYENDGTSTPSTDKKANTYYNEDGTVYTADITEFTDDPSVTIPDSVEPTQIELAEASALSNSDTKISNFDISGLPTNQGDNLA